MTILSRLFFASIFIFVFSVSNVAAQLFVVDPGDVGVGTDTPDGKLHVVGDVVVDGSGTKDVIIDDGTIYFERDSVVSRIIQNGGRALYFATGTTAGSWSDTLKLYSNGDAEVTGTFTHSSDIRKKKDVKPLEGALEKVVTLTAVSYKMSEGPDDATTIGLAAQEVEKVFPELVRTNPEGYKSVAYAHLVAPLIEAVKEQQAQIRSEQANNTALLQRLEQLEKQQLALIDRLNSSRLASVSID